MNPDGRGGKRDWETAQSGLGLSGVGGQRVCVAVAAQDEAGATSEQRCRGRRARKGAHVPDRD